MQKLLLGNEAIAQGAIDAGMSGIELQKRLSLIGVELSVIDAILVTHEHNDHVQSVGVLSRRANIPVYANAATFSADDNPL